MMNNVWTERYRPQSVSELIVPTHVTNTLNSYIESGDCVNLLFVSTKPGTGKTTAAKALGNDLQCEVKVINSYKDNSIDALRTKVLNFVSTQSLTHDRKMVIFDEADRLTSTTLDGLRGFIETYNDVRFIFTCNYANRIIEPVLSRMYKIDFNYVSTSDKRDMLTKLAKRVRFILDDNNIKYTSDAIKQIVLSKFPDLRQIIIELETNSKTGELVNNIKQTDDISDLIDMLKHKKHINIRNWVSDNTIDILDLQKLLQASIMDHLSQDDIPAFIYATYDSQYKLNFIADKEIHMTSYLFNLSELNWK